MVIHLIEFQIWTISMIVWPGSNFSTDSKWMSARAICLVHFGSFFSAKAAFRRQRAVSGRSNSDRAESERCRAIRLEGRAYRERVGQTVSSVPALRQNRQFRSDCVICFGISSYRILLEVTRRSALAAVKVHWVSEVTGSERWVTGGPEVNLLSLSL